ncbi:YhdP family protein [Cupriavidus sp. AU9028]|uniref:YhdP family protein n=1 Tax=Cupriavidus sp. AU9028 TaxID=2871157 RepID=UPI001C972C35|nr:YhdP family protein [Cupriavidus sp. AU9028]MBY4895816.1 TIGR02099 family protein [Cupriavidus sp. AU9028]
MSSRPASPADRPAAAGTGARGTASGQADAGPAEGGRAAQSDTSPSGRWRARLRTRLRERCADGARRLQPLPGACLALLRHPFWRRLGRAMAAVLLALLAMAAVLVLLMRFVLWPQAASARAWLEQKGSIALSAQLTIETLETGWDGWHPSFRAKGIRVLDDRQRTLLAAENVAGELSWRSLGSLDLLFARLDADGADLLIQRTPDGALRIAGLPVGQGGPDTGDHRFTNWLLSQGHLDLRRGQLRWLDEQRGLPLLEVGDIALQARRDGSHHTVRLEGRAPSLSPRQLVVTGAFRHQYLQETGDWRNWRGQANWNLGDLRLAAIQRYLPLFDSVASGVLGTDGTVEFDDGNVLRSQVRLRAADIDLKVGGASQPLRLGQAQALLLHRNERGDNQLTIDTLLWEAAGDAATPAPGREAMRQVTLRWAHDSRGNLRRFALKAPTLDLDGLRTLASAMPLTGETAKRLRALQPSGRIDNLDLNWSREAGTLLRPTSPPRYRAQGVLRNVAVREQPASARGESTIGVPGFSGLSGSFQFDERAGTARLEGSGATLVLPGLFEDPRLAFDELAGELRWQRKNGRLTVRSDGIRFANADAAGAVRGSWRQGGDGRAGLADLAGELSRAALPSVPRYLPLQVPAATRRYLSGALAAGESHDVRFSLKGDLAHFPFRRGDEKHGDFHVEVPLQQASYQVAPQIEGRPWPLFTNIDGKLVFDRASMTLLAERAAVQGIQQVVVRDVSGRIDALDSHGRLTLEGSAQGPVHGFLRYLVSSPIHQWTGGIAAGTRASGNGELQLKLDMPLVEAEKAHVEGRFRLQGNDVLLRPGTPMLTGAQGSVAFREHGFTLENVRARLLGGEVRASGGTQQDGTVRVTAAGVLSGRGISQLLAGTGGAGLASRVEGSAPWQASIGVRDGQPSVQLQADLQAMALNLPAPLTKPAGQPMPLRFEMRPAPNRAGMQDVDLQLGPAQASPLLHARYLVRHGGDGLEIAAGGIGIGQTAALPASGVAAAMAVERFDLDAWRAALAAPSPAQPATAQPAPAHAAPSQREQAAALPPAPAPGEEPPPQASAPATAETGATAWLPTRIAASARALHAFGRDLDGVTLEASRLEGPSQGWQARIDSRQIAGLVSWREDPQNSAGAVTLRLARLDIPDSQDTSRVADALAGQVHQLPAIDLAAERFQLRGHDFGKLLLRAHTEVSDGEPVWTLDKLSLEQPGATFTGSGSWRVPRRVREGVAAERRTLLNFEVDIRNAGEVLDRLGMPHTLEGGKGQLQGRIGWIGSPLAIDYESLGGRLAMKLENGQILAVEPGAAKLLGVLSLQSLMRLVTLDFRALTGQGLVFDQISATGTISNGIARTGDFQLKSPQVSATMTGTANIPRETQDLEVALVPRINATTASVAAAFVNPALGIGTLAAQLLFADEFSKAFTQHYRVTGSWADPKIAKVGDNKAGEGIPDHRQPEQSYLP